MTHTIQRACAAVLVLALFGSVLASTPASADDPIDETLREFYRTGKYVIYVSGERQKDAKIYHSRRAGAFLITGLAYGKPLLIQPRQKALSTLPAGQVAERSDKGVDILKGADIEKLGSFRLERGDVAINIEGLIARLQPRPYLLGANKAEDLLLHTPDYVRGVKGYTPSSQDLKRLKGADGTLAVTIFFGSWCPTCRRLLPRILRVDQELAGTGIDITYYGLPKGKAMRQDPEARRNGIKRIPTGVIVVGGRSAGHISSKAWNRPERALRHALSN